MSTPRQSEERGGEAAVAIAERRRGLAAAIASVAVFGIGIGLAAPLLSLLLERSGTEAALTGLNASAIFLGVVLGPMLAPLLVRRLGIRGFLLLFLALDIVFFLALKVFESFAAWFVLRVLLGTVGSGIFTATEAWINLLARDDERGRVIGIYAAFLSAGFGVGPLMLAATGTTGWAPFLAASAISAVAALPLLMAGGSARGFGREPARNPLAMFARAPFIVAAVAMFGFYESALISLLPVWGVRMGFDERLAAACLTAVYFGAIALQVPIGWLSDRLTRRAAMLLCALVGFLGAALVMAIGADAVPLFIVLFLWGGFATGIYPVALSMAGERFRGADLVTINAAIIIAYGLGSLMGPPLGGVAMDLWNPHGLLAMLTALFAALTALSLAERGARDREDRSRV
ncbi:MAG TPA: MFS transporter [Stellaceae bacterium]|nr:MFS transporter [Stellaceae bacterium]